MSTGTSVSFALPGGGSARGYEAGPAVARDTPGVVVIQEWWGLNSQIQGVADRVARLGYRALVPDLYGGRLAEDAAEAQHLMTSLDWGAAVNEDLAGAVAHLGADGMPVAVMGFCMGGALTLLAAGLVPGVSAGVCFYGIPPADALDLANLRVPIQAHFARHDDWCTPAAVDALEERFRAGKVDHEVYRYDAHHAFMNQTRPEVYDPSAAAEAWERTTEFLARRLR